MGQRDEVHEYKICRSGCADIELERLRQEYFNERWKRWNVSFKVVGNIIFITKVLKKPKKGYIYCPGCEREILKSEMKQVTFEYMPGYIDFECPQGGHLLLRKKVK